MDITTVGAHLSVGADASPDACGAYALVVLASREHQHVGETYPTTVLRCPLLDDDVEPSVAEIKRAQACAERVAFTICPFGVPFDVYKRFAPPPLSDYEPLAPRDVLVTCEAGENRSLWVAGMALVLSGEQLSGKAAREHLEKLRGKTAFENRHMRKLLDAFYPESIRAWRPPGPAAKTGAFRAT